MIPAVDLPDWIDVDKLAAVARDAALSQPPRVRLAVLEAIERSDTIVTEDDDGWLRLSIEGAAFVRVHPSRVQKTPI